MKEELVDQETVANGKKRLLTLFGILITLLLLGLLLYYVNVVRPVTQFHDLYTQAHYTEAYSFYEDHLKRFGITAQKGEEIVKEEVLRIWTAYQNASADQDTLDQVLASAARYENMNAFLSGLEPDIQVLSESRSRYTSGLSHLEQEEWLSAAEDFSRMSETDCLYKEGKEQALAAQKGYSSLILSESEALMNAADYDGAMALTDEALTHFPDNEELKAFREKIYTAYQEHEKQDSLARVQKALDQQNLTEAMRILAPLKEKYPEDTQILEISASCEEAYAGQILSKARPLFEQGAYEEVLQILAPARELLSSNTEIQALYDETSGHLPAWLCDFPNYENVTLRGTRKKGETAVDTFGNTYGHVLLYAEPSALSMQAMSYTQGRETYTLSGAYTRLLGTLAVKEGSRGIKNDQTGTFRIYGDEQLLLEIPGISENTEPVSFSLDVTDVDLLSITFESGTGLKYLLGDACLYKTWTPSEP